MVDSLGGISTNLSPDPKGGFWEGRLTPYVQLGGIEQYSPTTRSSVNLPVNLLSGRFTPIRRFTLAVSPIATLPYPNSGEAKWMVDLDSEQLYTMSADRVGVSSGPGYAFGKPWKEPSPDLDAPCWEAYGTGDGAYISPVPVQGLPVEFRKVYFRGLSVNEYGCTSGSGSGECGTYYAYFPCSLPVKQTCASGTGTSGITCNPRNENYGIMSGEVVPWSDFDIGCGEGGGGCPTSISTISGSSGFCGGSGFIAQGCDQVLEFRLGGCLTGSGRLEGGPVQFSGCVTQSGSTAIVTHTLNPNLYSAISGAGLPGPGEGEDWTMVCSPSGCDSILAFEVSGCLTGNKNLGPGPPRSQFSSDVACDGNVTTVTFGLDPDIYQNISGGGTSCRASGCDSTLAFEISGCLTGDGKFSHNVACSGDTTTVTFGINPDIYNSVSGNGTSCTASGCDSTLAFEISGCLTGDGKFSHNVACSGGTTTVTFGINPDIYNSVSGNGTSVNASGCDSQISFEASGCPDFGLSVSDEGGRAHIVFSLTGDACSGGGGSGITGTENIGDGSGIASGVVDNIAYFKSLIGGDNLEIAGDEYGESLTLNVTGISGGGITGTENLGAGSGIATGVIDDIAYFKSLIGGTYLEIDGDAESLTLNVTGISAGGGCTGFTSVTADGITSEPDSCGSGITFEATGCLGLEAEALYDGIKIKYGISDTQLLECLGYYEKEIEICEGDESVAYTFLVKDSG